LALGATQAFGVALSCVTESTETQVDHYNFVRIHQTLRCTPAMAAGVTTKLWELADLVKVLEDWEARQIRQPQGKAPDLSAD